MADDRWQTKDLPADEDYLAPDGSEIRLLLAFARGGLAHCTLPAGATASAVKHKTVEEIWYVLEGEGEVWRREGKDEKIIQIFAGRALAIDQGVEFQFRNTGEGPLRLIIATLPKWPGPMEAEPVEGRWDGA
jgi:mannose-6-phosphate isomerase-like protein (cupin superfamily)